MRVLQFWILMLCSCIVTFLYLRQIVLERELDEQQRLVVDGQEAVTEGNAYENAWKQLAMSIYTNSRQDPEFARVLRMENVDVRPGVPPPSAGSSGAAPAAGANPAKAAGASHSASP